MFWVEISFWLVVLAATLLLLAFSLGLRRGYSEGWEVGVKDQSDFEQGKYKAWTYRIAAHYRR